MPGHVYKRGNIWWIKFYSKGKLYRKSSKSTKKSDAQKLLSRHLGEVATGTFKGFHEETISMREVFDDFEVDCRRRKLRSLDTVVYHMKPIRSWFEAMNGDQITERDIDRYIKHRLSLDRSTTTVNRELQYLGQSLRLARRKKLLNDIPHIEKFREDNARQGFFDKEDFERLVSFLPDDLKDFVRFAYYSGWRKGEIAQLEWRDIEGDVVRLRPTISKTKDGRVLVLVGELAEIIERRRAARLDLIPLVFHRVVHGKAGSPIRRFYRSWKSACQQAGIPTDRVFHDFRRSAVRNMTRAGVPRQTAKQISGHKTDSIFNRYDIVDEEDIRDGLLKTQAYLEEDGHKIVTLNQENRG
jgi:integrase